MNREVLEKRTKKFHVDVIRFCEVLPRSAAGFEVAKQLIRSAGSVGANYRATLRAKSKADFIYKIEIILEEADESLYWLEIIKESKMHGTAMIDNAVVDTLIKEANELTAIFVSSAKTAKMNRRSQI